MTVSPRFRFTGKESRNIHFQVSGSASSDTSNSWLRLWEMLSWLFQGVRGTQHLPLRVCQSLQVYFRNRKAQGEHVGLCLVALSSGGPPCPPTLEQINLSEKPLGWCPVLRACTCERRVCKSGLWDFLQGCSRACCLSLLWPAVLLGSDVFIHLA